MTIEDQIWEVRQKMKESNPWGVGPHTIWVAPSTAYMIERKVDDFIKIDKSANADLYPGSVGKIWDFHVKCDIYIPDHWVVFQGLKTEIMKIHER